MLRAALAAIVAALLATGCGSQTPTKSATTVETAIAVETVTVTAPQPGQSQPDGGVRSELIPVTLPPGTKLADDSSKSNGMEVWATPTSYADNIKNLREQLPLKSDLEGIPWCSEEINTNNKMPYVQWTWSDDKQSIVVYISKKTGKITIRRGPDDSGRQGYCDAP